MGSPFFIADGIDSTGRAVLVAVAVITIMLTVVRPFMKRKKDPLSRPATFGSLAQQRSVERQMQNVLVEMSEMARQITAQLDTRAARLEMLIKDADQRLEALKSATLQPPAQSVATEALTNLLNHRDSANGDAKVADTAKSNSATGAAARSEIFGEDPARSNAARPDANASAQPAPVDPKHLQIYRLADQGRSAREIAQELNRPSGEIELILALRG
jgi:hypothetical protein